MDLQVPKNGQGLVGAVAPMEESSAQEEPRWPLLFRLTLGTTVSYKSADDDRAM